MKLKNCLKEYKDRIIITSPSVVRNGWIHKMGYGVYFKVREEPTVDRVEDIVGQIKELQKNKTISNIIGIGGGSVMDTAKLVHDRFLGSKLILIPTLFGNGAHATNIAVLKNEEGKCKISLKSRNYVPDTVLYFDDFIKDPDDELREELKFQEIDALAHAVEAFENKKACWVTLEYCSNALKGILSTDKISKKEKRLRFIDTSTYAALGMNTASTTLAHALSYPFSLSGYRHNRAIAKCLLPALAINNSMFFMRICDYFQRINLPKYKLTLSMPIEEAVNMVMEDKYHLENNPIEVTREDVKRLLEIIMEN